MKKILNLSLVIIMFTMLSVVAYGQLPTCGGATACACNNELVESRVLTAADNLTNCTGDGLIIFNDSLTLNCNGYEISGTGNHSGILVGGFDDVVIQNCDITNFSAGINSSNSIGLTIVQNEISNNYYGIIFNTTNSSLIDNNDILNSGYDGIYTSFSNYNNITNNNIYDTPSDSAVWLDADSDFNIVSGNDFVNGSYAVAVYGDSGVGVDYNLISDNTATNFTYGVYLYYANGTTVDSNTLTNCEEAIVVYYADNNTITQNTLVGDESYANTYGIYVDAPAENNNFSGNEVSGFYYGMYAYEIMDIFVQGDEYYDNHYGIYLDTSGVASPEFTEINVHENCEGMYLYSSIAHVYGGVFTGNNMDAFNFCDVPVDTGLYLDNSDAYIDGGTFSNNGPYYNIFADNSSYVEWYEDQYQGTCTNNALSFKNGYNVSDGITRTSCPILPEEAIVNCSDLINESITLTHPIDCRGLIYNYGLEVGADGITIDCNGWSIIGDNSGSGVYIDTYDGVTVQNCDITGFSNAVDIQGSANATVQNNNLYDNGDGVHITSSFGVQVLLNIMSDGGLGVEVLDSIYSIISGNTISNMSDPAISLVSGGRGSYHTVNNNDITVPSSGYAGIYVSDDNNQILDNVIGCDSGMGIPVGLGELGIARAGATGIYVDGTGGIEYNNTFSGNEVFGCYRGFDGYYADNFTVYEDNYHDNMEGMYLYNSYGTVIDTDFTDNLGGERTGIYLSGSEIDLINSNFINNGDYGIYNESMTTVYWTLLKDVYCTDNDIFIGGWLLPLGGQVIRDNCSVWVNGELLPDDQQGAVVIGVNTTNGTDTVGGDDFGVEAEIHVNDTNGTVTGDIEINFYDENPGGNAFALSALGLWVDVDVDPAINNSLDYWILKLYYTDEQLAEAGLTESSLEIQYYNNATGQWEGFAVGGVNTDENYVWARIDHFSIFGIFGAAPSRGPSGGSRSTGFSKPDFTLTSNPQSVSLRHGLSNKVGFESEEHIIRVVDMEADWVKLEITSEAQEVELNIGDSALVDLNQDGSSDMYIKLESIFGNEAKFTVQLAGTEQEEVVLEDTTEQPEETAAGAEDTTALGGEEPAENVSVQEPVDEPAKSNTGLIVVAVIALLVIAGIIYAVVVKK